MTVGWRGDLHCLWDLSSQLSLTICSSLHTTLQVVLWLIYEMSCFAMSPWFLASRGCLLCSGRHSDSGLGSRGNWASIRTTVCGHCGAQHLTFDN